MVQRQGRSVIDVLGVVRASDIPVDVEAVASTYTRAPRKFVGDILGRLAKRRVVLRDADGR